LLDFLQGSASGARHRARRTIRRLGEGGSSIPLSQVLLSSLALRKPSRLQRFRRRLKHRRPKCQRLPWTASLRAPIILRNIGGSSSLRSTRPSSMIVLSEPGPKTCRTADARRMTSAAMGFATEIAAPHSGPVTQGMACNVKKNDHCVFYPCIDGRCRSCISNAECAWVRDEEDPICIADPYVPGSRECRGVAGSIEGEAAPGPPPQKPKQ
jgi:hypothetical protein